VAAPGPKMGRHPPSLAQIFSMIKDVALNRFAVFL
jgi:hypothetical protein